MRSIAIPVSAQQLKENARRVRAIVVTVVLISLLSTVLNLALAQVPGVVPAVSVTVEAPDNDNVRWVLPGPRGLESGVFGTPAQPLGFEAAPDIGVAIEARLVSEDGSAFTTTAGMTPHSDNSAPISGRISFSVTDITAVDGADTEDEIDFISEFIGPNGDKYRIMVDKALPRGPVHPFFGGVVTNAYLHGGTGIGTKPQPRQFVYAGFWGVGQLYRNGELVADNQLVHVMLSQRVRTPLEDGYRLVFSDEVNQLSGRQVHVILPPVTITATGPQPRPVPTGFNLPNGQEQPFVHLMFDDVGQVTGGLR